MCTRRLELTDWVPSASGWWLGLVNGKQLHEFQGWGRGEAKVFNPYHNCPYLNPYLNCHYCHQTKLGSIHPQAVKPIY